MAINVMYGPISSALGLAQVAGQGQGFNIQSQRDLQALQVQNSLQQTANQYAENQVQNTLAREELSTRLAAQQQQQQQENTYRQAQQQLDQQRIQQSQQSLQQQQQQFQTEQHTRDQQAQSIDGVRQQQLQDRQKRDEWLKGLNPDQQAIVLSGGHLPNQIEIDDAKRRQDQAHTEQAYKQADLLRDQIAMLNKQLDPLSGLSVEERAATQARLKDSMNRYNMTIDGINAATGSRVSGSGMQPGGSASAILPDAEKAKLLLEMAKQLNLPPDDPRVIKAATAAAPAYASQVQQATNFSQQQLQVRQGYDRQAANQSAYDEQKRRKDEQDQMWASWAQNQGNVIMN